MPEKVLINGAGTVGSRIARLLLSMDIPVVAVKRTANINDIKTQELLSIYREFKDKDMEFYVSNGEDYKKRMKGLERD